MARTKKQGRDFSKFKLATVAGLFVVLLTALWVRAGYLQLYRGSQLEALASRQSYAAEFERGQRGRILSRDGTVLATSVEAHSVYARPIDVPQPAAAARKLREILDIPEAEVRKQLGSRKNFVWIKRQISDVQAKAVAEAHLDGVHLTTEYNRLYPNGHLGGQILGFVDVDGKGLEGVEATFEERLAAGQAKLVVQRDAAGRRLYLDDQGREMDINGRDVRLSIDSHIQDLTEQALAEAVRKYEAQSGMAIVVHVKSGEILALANYPFFNPNVSRSSPASVRRNRAALDVVEPGSTMKPFLVAAALEEKVVTPEQLIDCENGKWKIRSKIIRDDHPHRWLTVNQIIRYSSNIGAAKVGQALGSQRFYDYLLRFGFGSRPGVTALSGGSGILHPAQSWSDIDLAAISFGQAIGVTALQMAKAYLCLANMGEAKPLRLVLDPAPEAPEAGGRVVNEKAAQAVLSMMREVVEMDGTGKKARIPGVPVVGKTGTAQKAGKGGYSDERLSSFVGLIPGDNPEFLVLALVDEPKTISYGGVVAAPAVKDIASRALAYYGRLPDAPEEAEETRPDPDPSSMTAQVLPAGQPRTPGEMVPDLSGLPLRRAVELLVQKGIVPVVKGRGMVVSGQKPAAGEPWPEGREGKDDVFVLILS
ncbi:MAG TPA: penicillin-binding transpeptidase domain-containing protein [Desulfovibrio sp.]|uniref:penicillin-binding transpeptidase domain-containing protein n=1 Tax=Desulfovibrio sp. TaxID=885 RepID=UPI002B93E0B2|nr:penicillin-binding transpeptidase domain-containing protein [Desulfovibrio sp.]HMM39531.1 penicillin-binding transpeptidase domain-containing protein [Desulfovibrio sp.]